MNNLLWKNIGRFVLLMLLQLLVLDNVYLGGYVVPVLYVLFVLMLPIGMGRVPMLLTSFATGLLVDVMAGTLGFNALACTVVMMCRLLFADRILTRGEEVVIDTPSIHRIAPVYYVSYLLLLYAIFFLIFLGMEMFSFRGLGDMLVATLASTLVSTAMSILYQFLFVKNEDKK